MENANECPGMEKTNDETYRNSIAFVAESYSCN